jgi:hypothetical protein
VPPAAVITKNRIISGTRRRHMSMMLLCVGGGVAAMLTRIACDSEGYEPDCSLVSQRACHPAAARVEAMHNWAQRPAERDTALRSGQAIDRLPLISSVTKPDYRLTRGGGTPLNMISIAQRRRAGRCPSFIDDGAGYERCSIALLADGVLSVLLFFIACDVIQAGCSYSAAGATALLRGACRPC